MNKIMMSSVTALAVSLAFPAYAQSTAEQGAAATPAESAEPSQGVSDIVVTAQRRSENIQKVPVSVTAVTSAQLASAGVQNLDNLSTVVAGFVGTGDNGNQAPHIRGIGNQAVAAGNDSSVAYYIDGVYIAAINPALVDLNSVAQVEVLKGPQGTLFGRNSTGGLINVTTRKPTDTFVAEGEIGYGNYQTISGSAYVAGPVANGIAADIAVQASHQGKGYGIDLTDGREVRREPLSLSVRSKWVFDLTDSTNLTLSGDYERVKQYGLGDFRTVPGELSASGYVHQATGWNTENEISQRALATAGGVSGKLVQEFDFATLTSTTAYRESDWRVPNNDIDESPIADIYGDAYVANRQFSQEFQLTGSSSTPLQWQAGLYYYWGKDIGMLTLYGPTIPLIPDFGGADHIHQDGIERTNSYSAYAQGTYKLTDSTRLTLGGRYTYEKRRIDGDFSGDINGTEIFSFPGGQSLTAKVFTWRAALDQDLGRDILAYASVNRGFKSGGFNVYIYSAPAYKPEQLTSFEGGLKTELFDRKLRLNFAAFYYDYKNIQVTHYDGILFQIDNGAKARVYGLDVDMEARVSSQFTLSGNIELLNPTFKSFDGASFYTPNPAGGFDRNPGDASGNDLPFASRFTASVSGVYKIPTSFGEFQLSGTYSYNDGFYAEPDNRLRQPAFHLVSAGLQFTTPDEHFYAKIWGKNLANEQVVNYLTTGVGSTSVSLNSPRTYGVTAGFKF